MKSPTKQSTKANAKQAKSALKVVAAPEVVEALFDVIVDEAKRNERFARRLMSVYPETIVARTTRSKTPTSTFDAAEYHAVNILRNHGTAMLRGRLSSLRTKSELTQVAKRSGLRLTGKAARKTAAMTDIIDGIVDAAEHYVAQRGAAKK